MTSCYTTVRHPVGYNPDLSVRLLHVVRSIFFWYNWAALYNIWTKDYLNYSRHMTQTTVISELDRFKLQKKRERNRIAASKCRQRKLERISDLGNPDDSNCSKKLLICGVLIFVFRKSSGAAEGRKWYSYEIVGPSQYWHKVSRKIYNYVPQREATFITTKPHRQLKNQIDSHLRRGCRVEGIPLDGVVTTDYQVETSATHQTSRHNHELPSHHHQETNPDSTCLS